MKEKCKNCEVISNGSIIKLDNDSNCLFCGKKVGYPTPMKTKPISDEWEKEFDIIYDCYFVSKPSTETARSHLKDFIRNLITTQQTAHEAELERIKKGTIETWEVRIR